jgi:FMN-dependent oxidoreductase (nitrilotriacetate monooxygenase family)
MSLAATGAGPRHLHLNVNILHSGFVPSAWRLAEADPRAFIDVNHYVRVAQMAEAAKFDAVFLADNAAIVDQIDFNTITALEPTVLLASIAAATTRIGVIGTASTSYNEPYNIARRFATLDHVSNGRAGWNVVTTADLPSARNFGRDAVPDHAQRYERADEFTGLVKALWNSWEDGALVADKTTGRFVDLDRLHPAAHRGRFFKVKGPLNVSRSPQGHPVIVQAGQSEDGRALAAAVAEVIFTAHQRLDTAQEFYRDIKSRAAANGRNPAHVLIMPGVSPFVGRTEAEAREKYDRLTSLILEEDGIALLNGLTGGTLDLNGLDLDGPLPPAPPTEGMKSRQTLIRQIADENGFTIRQLYQWIASARGHHTVIGSAEQVADRLQEWFENEAADGFNILPPYFPGGFDDFVDQVVPELQRRGLHRKEYAGTTLRDHLGLPRSVPGDWRPRKLAAE